MAFRDIEITCAEIPGTEGVFNERMDFILHITYAHILCIHICNCMCIHAHVCMYITT